MSRGSVGALVWDDKYMFLSVFLSQWFFLGLSTIPRKAVFPGESEAASASRTLQEIWVSQAQSSRRRCRAKGSFIRSAEAGGGCALPGRPCPRCGEPPAGSPQPCCCLCSRAAPGPHQPVLQVSLGTGVVLIMASPLCPLHPS